MHLESKSQKIYKDACLRCEIKKKHYNQTTNQSFGVWNPRREKRIFFVKHKGSSKSEHFTTGKNSKMFVEPNKMKPSLEFDFT